MALSVDREINKAKSLARKGEIEQAGQAYRSILEKFPSNKRALEGLKMLGHVKGASPGRDQLNDLLGLYNQGRFQDALTYGGALAAQFPHSSDVFNILGAASAGLNDLEQAAEHYRNALRINPGFADAHNNLGNVLADLNRLDDAVESYRRALQFAPGNAQFHNNLGAAYYAQGHYEEAFESYSTAINLGHEFAELQNNLGLTLAALGRLDDAVASYQRALNLRPDYAEAYNNLGLTYVQLDRVDDAIDSYNKALQISKNFADAQNNLGLALAGIGRHREAIECFLEAIQLDPGDAKIPNNLGISFNALGDGKQAIEYFTRSLDLFPGYADAHNNLGNTLVKFKRLDEAIESYSKALEIKPDFAKAMAQKLQQQAITCDWRHFESNRDVIAKLGIEGDAVPPYGMLALEDNPARHLTRAKRYSAETINNSAAAPIAGPSKKHDRLRIGYFSADFRNHAMMYLMSRQFELHDREKFDLYAYSLGPAIDDEMRRRQIAAFDVFSDVHQESNEQVVARVRRDEIDIAVDLNGYTAGNRAAMFAHRLAPVQVSYLGFAGSMGAPFMDYILADKTVIPEDQICHFSEKVIYLPDTYLSTDNTRAVSDTAMSRSSLGLPEEGFVFCCFNHSHKITPDEFDIWMRLLQAVSGSVLWLLGTNKWAEQNLKMEARARGVDPDRLIFAEQLPLEEHLARHRFADLFLDTFIYNAHTTASDALWTGLPVVTKLGGGFAARVAGSLLRAIQLPELITESEAAYEKLALDLALNPDKLRKIKAKLADNRRTTALFNTELFTRNVEDAYRKAYQRYCDGLPPDTLHVEGGN